MPFFTSHTPGSFCLFELSAHDLPAAKSFYSSLFGWQSADNPNSPVGVYTMFIHNGHDAAGAYRQFQAQTDAGFPPYWDLYIAVTSADEAAEKAVRLGGKLAMAPFDIATYGRMAVLVDPAGAPFCVWEAKSHIGVGVKNEPGSFCWADLVTPAPDVAAVFYHELFGWTTVPGEGGYLHLKNGEEFIGGIQTLRGGPAMRPHWMSYVQVSDCAASFEKAVGLKAKPLMPPANVGTAGQMAIVADPQGAVFALFEVAA